ncbi:hypothetical protein JOM56_013991 [Amanita muscaria]
MEGRAAEGRNDMTLVHEIPSSPDFTGFDSQFPFPFDGTESSQAGQVLRPCHIFPNGDFRLPTSLIAGSSPQSPVGLSAAGQLSNQELTDFNPQGVPFGGNGYSEAVGQVPWALLIPPYFPTSFPIIGSPPQSPVEPSPSEHLSSQDLTYINSQGFLPFTLGGNEHSQPGDALFNPFSGAAGLSTSYPIIDSHRLSHPWGPLRQGTFQVRT